MLVSKTQVLNLITQITDRIFIGDCNYTKEDLAEHEINYVINLCGQCTGYEDRWIHLADDNTNPDFLVNGAVNELANRLSVGYKVLVHCREGRSRSPFIIALWLERCGFGWLEANRFVKARYDKVSIEPLLFLSHDTQIS